MSTYTFDEITAKILANGSKASKIDWLCNEAGFTPTDAENTYRLIIAVNPRPAATRRQRREAREAAFELIHFTVGVELECVNVSRAAVRDACAARGIQTRDDFHNYNHNDSADTYKLMSDSSLRGGRRDRYQPCEIVTPVLNDLSSLKTVCEVLREAGAKVNKSCGLHVHFGAANFTVEQWRRIVINYARIEDIIDSFMPESRRENNSQWCASVKSAARDLECRDIDSFDIIRRQVGGRYHKVNLEAFDCHHTIEFRQHAGTIEFTKIENWVNFLAGLLTYSINNTDILTATSIDELPFLSDAQKRFFKARANEFARREGRETRYEFRERRNDPAPRRTHAGYDLRAADLASAFAL